MIKRILLAVTTGLFLLAGAVTYANSAECEHGSFEQFKEAMTAQEATTIQLDDTQVQAIFGKYGTPPNGKEGVHYVGHYVVVGETAGLFFFQEGCLVNRIGPGPKFMILNILDLVEAGR